MKLDFSALAQPAQKARVQAGTTGTPAFTRVSASPLVQPCAGTTGDKAPAVVVRVADPLVAIPAACPPASPACPQAADAEKINAGAVSPASPLVPIQAAQGAAAAPFECEDLDNEPKGARVNICGDCLHLLRRGTCGEPVAAGLLTAEEGFGIVWPAEGHAITCPSYTDKAPSKAQDRPYRLTQVDADTCHAGGWDDAEISRFQARAASLRRGGIGDDDADDLAERLTLRDRQQDDRVMCLECSHYRPGRCCNHRSAGLPGSEVGRDLAALLQRCPGFQSMR